jgi:SAM-dependent methyltransferase
MKNYTYIGSELELFRSATHWKDYYYSLIRPYLGRTVLEVGAGMGGTTRVLYRGSHDRWVCLEPDRLLIDQLKEETDRLEKCEIRHGTLAHISLDESFDSILYIDVLEHIEDDRTELQQAFSYLKPGGFLVVLSPAHQWLFSPFDRSIGHYRRYTKSSLCKLLPHESPCIKMQYLDSVGLLASLSNRWLNQAMPTARQIRFWDTWMVPLSRLLDPVLRYAIGKSILGIWKKNELDPID